IGSYIGEGNAFSAEYPDVWIGKSERCKIDSIVSKKSGTTAVTVRNDALNYEIVSIDIRNAGQTTKSAVGLAINGGNGTLNKVLVGDDQELSTTRNGVSISSGAVGKLTELKGFGFTGVLLSNNSPLTFQVGLSVVIPMPPLRLRIETNT
ncbi:MAG: hypothetical protein GYA55_11610, partial [SAR324 cluster bacterium]|nr:hypothetical protein [SAR324 cluster bacterium]